MLSLRGAEGNAEVDEIEEIENDDDDDDSDDDEDEEEEDDVHYPDWRPVPSEPIDTPSADEPGAGSGAPAPTPSMSVEEIDALIDAEMADADLDDLSMRTVEPDESDDDDEDDDDIDGGEFSWFFAGRDAPQAAARALRPAAAADHPTGVVPARPPVQRGAKPSKAPMHRGRPLGEYMDAYRHRLRLLERRIRGF